MYPPGDYNVSVRNVFVCVIERHRGVVQEIEEIRTVAAVVDWSGYMG